MKKMIWLSIVTMILLQIFTVPALAKDNDKESGMITTVYVKDDTTGEVTEYPYYEADSKTSIDKNGEIINEIEVSNTTAPMTRAGQSNNDVFYGWEGKVNIKYSVDDTYACLKQATASWKRKSGSVKISKKNLIYGQDLATNSKNGSFYFNNSKTAVVVNWPKGKYGYGLGYKLGAVLSAKIKGKTIYICCQKTF